MPSQVIKKARCSKLSRTQIALSVILSY